MSKKLKPEKYETVMKVVKRKPPIYKKIIAAGMKPTKFAYYTYGDKIYNPSGQDLPDYIIVHEEVHMKQQEEIGGPEIWWDRYIRDQYFRIEQEVAAYAVQYRFFCKSVKDREKRHKFLSELAWILASPTYGSVITTAAAHDMIKKKANVQ